MSEHERQLLGCILIEPSRLAEVTRTVRGRDFADPDMGRLFDLLAALDEAGRPIGDVTVLVPSLREYGELPQTVAGPVALGRLIHDAGSAVHARYHAEAIREAAQRLRAADVARALLEAAEGSQPLAEVLRRADAELSAIGAVRCSATVSAREAALQLVEELGRRPDRMAGVEMGLPPLDAMLGPMAPGELIVVAARPGCGKSALALQAARTVAEDGGRALFVSLEMTAPELARRLLAADGIQISRRRQPDLVSAQAAAGALPKSLELWAPTGARVGEIRAEARLRSAREPLGLLVVDYIGLVTPDDLRQPRHEQVSAITRRLKQLAQELGCAVLACCQLNREADGRQPTLAMLRESGSVEQDADAVVFVHHADGAHGSEPRNVEIIVAKRRNGPTGLVRVEFRPRETRFVPIPQPRHAAFDNWNATA